MANNKTPLGDRLGAWARRNPILVIASAATVVISSIVVLAGAVTTVVHWYERNYDWRSSEYRRLDELRAGFTLAKFEASLGVPLFARTAPHTNLIEDTFQGREYWVQTVSDHHGMVLVYAVTSCRPDFTPTFRLPPYEGHQQMVTLNRTVPNNVLYGFARKLITADYFVGNTADTYFYDLWSGANPGLYKGFAWGLNDACANWYRIITRLEVAKLLPAFYYQRSYHGHVDNAPPSVSKFRQEVPVNTYAETAPGTYFSELGKELHIGADRLLTRTVEEQESLTSTEARALRRYQQQEYERYQQRLGDRGEIKSGQPN